METLLSKFGHAALNRPAIAQRVNHLLVGLSPRIPALPFDGGRLVCRLVHLGGGIYPTGRKATPHEHREIQIEYPLTGLFHFKSQGTELHLEPGEGMVLPPGVAHSWVCRKEGFMVGCQLALAGEKHDRLAQALRQEYDPARMIARSEKWGSHMREAMDALISIDRTPWAQEEAISLLMLWLRGVLFETEAFSAWLAKPDPVPVDLNLHGRDTCLRAREFMEANCARPLQASDVALQVGLSTRHLNRLFHQHQGLPLNAALTAIRLERARQMLLEDPDAPVKQIAYESGFSSPAYFSHCFRKAFGVTPRQCR